MRPDLNKVLCERERRGSDRGYDEYRHVALFERQYDRAEDVEDEPFHGVGSGHREGMKFRYGWDKKDFSEHLTPLYGILHKNVGRKWDKIYSEICSVFDMRSVVNDHILQHLYDRVPKPENTYIHENGQVYIRGGRYSREAEPVSGSRYPYFIDPRDGILKVNRNQLTYKQYNRLHERRRAAEEAKTKRVIDADTELLKLNGIWYKVVFRNVTGVERFVERMLPYSKRTIKERVVDYPFNRDAVTNRTVTTERVAVSKRTLSHKELLHHGLTND